MSNYEKQIQATEQHYYRERRKNEQNGGVVLSSVAPGSGRQGHEWADVLKDLEPYY